MSDEKSVKVVVPVEEFVSTWQNSNSAREVAEKLNMDISNVNARAKRLRDAGLKELKIMPPGTRGRRINIEELRKLCIVE